MSVNGPSVRLAALLNLAKSESMKFDWQSVAKSLAWCYSEHMRLPDVVHHVLEALKEVAADKRYEIAGEMGELVLAPIKGHSSIDPLGPNCLQTVYSVEQFYGAMIEHVLSRLRCARVDWCSQALVEERKASDKWRLSACTGELEGA